MGYAGFTGRDYHAGFIDGHHVCGCHLACGIVGFACHPALCDDQIRHAFFPPLVRAPIFPYIC